MAGKIIQTSDHSSSTVGFDGAGIKLNPGAFTFASLTAHTVLRKDGGGGVLESSASGRRA